MRRPLPVGLSPRSGRSFAPGRRFPVCRVDSAVIYTPLTAAPHSVGCEVTRGGPGGGGEDSPAGAAGEVKYSRYSLEFECA